MSQSLFNLVLASNSRNAGPKGEQFTPRMRQIMMLAFQAAAARGENITNTEHLLLAVLREETNLGRMALLSFDIPLDVIEQTVINLMPSPLSTPVTAIEYSPEYVGALKSAVDEARNRKHTDIDGEHLLLGLLHQHDTLALQALRQLGITPEMIQDKINVLRE